MRHHVERCRGSKAGSSAVTNTPLVDCLDATIVVGQLWGCPSVIVVFGREDDGDAELADILMIVQNELSEKLNVVSPSNASAIISNGGKVLSPRISVKSEKWDGGHTYISISFFDYATNQSIAVVKSSGIGLSISHDQKLALSAIKKELNKTFK